MSSIVTRWLGLLLLAAAVTQTSGSVRACGPHFPNSVIVEGDGFVTSAPAAGFRSLVERIVIPTPRFRANRVWPVEQQAFTDRTGRRELLARLRALKVPAGVREDVLFSHADFRTALRQRRTGDHEGPLPTLHARMPAEFSLYLRGAAAYHADDRAGARAHWERILALPASERRYRSVWAAYMIGRSLVEDRPGEAPAWFERARTFARSGFHDRTALAAASYGWEARAALNHQDVARALELYLFQYATGDDSGLTSMRMAAAQALAADDERLAAVARNRIAREIVNAEVLAWHSAFLEWGHASKKSMLRWLAAVEAHGPADMRDADRLAWAAYRVGADDVAARWLAKAEPTSVIASWIRAKLLLRDGRIDEAATLLSTVVRSFESGAGADVELVWPSLEERQDTADKARGELAALRLSRGEAVQALDVLVRCERHWIDAAYIAELVLTPDELAAFVERVPTESRHADALRSLCARRFMRRDRYDDALAVVGEQRAWIQSFVDAVRLGRDASMPATERGLALWAAARTMRKHGMEIRGTELAPDFAIWNGAYEWPDLRSIRLDNDGPLTKPTPDERLRLKQRTDTVPNRRYHYRFVAADLGWEAAALMPDESEATARVLCTAGSWIKIADPDWADRFFQALVRRCGTTKLGAEAARLKWFPKIESD